MENYTISKKIKNTWLWKDPQRFFWWIDLVFMAKDTEETILSNSILITLKRGDILASQQYLSKLWGVCHITVGKFLKQLESQKMITRRIEKGKISIITICDFPKDELKSEPKSEQIELIQEDSFIDELHKDKAWQEVVGMNLRIPTLEEVNKLIDEFSLHVKATAQNARNLNEAKRHFVNWARISLQNENKNKKHGEFGRMTEVEQRLHVSEHRADEHF